MKVDKRPLKVVDIGISTRLYHKEYSRWLTIFKRCYDESWLEKHPTYLESEVCDEWLKFSNFLKWHQANYVEGWHLDKDLFGGGTLYGPETCCFIPSCVNKFLTKRASGVSKRGEVFITQTCMGAGNRHYNKTFNCEFEAKEHYTQKKLERALALADEYGLNDTLRTAIVKFVYTHF